MPLPDRASSIFSRCGVFVVEVPFDELFVVPLVEKLQTFWLDHVLTVMLPQNGAPIQCKLVFFVHSYCIWQSCLPGGAYGCIVSLLDCLTGCQLIKCDDLLQNIQYGYIHFPSHLI